MSEKLTMRNKIQDITNGSGLRSLIQLEVLRGSELG
jgi:hypothetical protein